MRVAHHPVLLIVGVLYLVAHTGIMLQQLTLWLRSMLAGRMFTHPHARLALVLHEVLSLSLHKHIVFGAIHGMPEVELADRCLILLAVVGPVFQHLLAANSARASGPADFFWAQRWWAFHALTMALGAISDFKPSHSLVQAVVSGTLNTLRQCLNSCYMHQDCSFTLWGMLRCLVVHGTIIQAAGALSWSTIFVVVRKHKQRERLARQSGAELASKDGSGVAASAGSGSGSARTKAGRQWTPSAAAASKRSAHAAGSPPTTTAVAGSGGDGALFTPAGVPGDVSGASESVGQQLPLEFFGVRIFRTMGLGPFFLWLDDRVTRLADQLEEAVLVRLVCLPVAGYSLAFLAMARLRFMNYDYGCVSYDMIVLWMAAWFMLGRDSATFDVMKALKHVQEQVASSLTALSRPRQQTVSELVDSARQRIAGGDAATNAAAVGDLKLLECLGEGSFGKVYKGIWRGTVVAVKSMVLPNGASSRRERMAIMEAAISSALSHPNILQTYTYSLVPVKDVSSASLATANDPGQAPQAPDGAAASRDAAAAAAKAGPHLAGPFARGFEVCLLLEYMDLGTLRDALNRHLFTAPTTGQQLDYCSVLDTAADVAKGMLHLHSLNIVHGDLKARNVLLKSSATDPRGFTSKISDFGLSHKMEAEETHVSKLFQGTPTHMAPEVLLHGKQSKAADVYAFGITMWELLTMGRPYLHVSPSFLPHYVAEQGERPRFPASSPEGYVRLAQRCWSKDAKSRPSFQEVVTVLTELQLEAYTSALSVTAAPPVGDARECIGLAPPCSAAADEAAAEAPVQAAASARSVRNTLDRWLASSQQSAQAPGPQGQPGSVCTGDLPAMRVQDASAATDSAPTGHSAGLLQTVSTAGDQHILLEQSSQETGCTGSAGADVWAAGNVQSSIAATQGTPLPGHVIEVDAPGSAIVMGQRTQDDTWFEWQRSAQGKAG